ncbi:acyl-CoA dehydrogenase family protein [Sphingopyxis kveilinensis]|uniref:acyl-CoA dehydrogenase family protein n=1 Tax=Sphingopyxis kveilinensis TaxID=3114367 RepID=UPI0030CA6264
MEIAFNPEQIQLSDSLRRFLDRSYGPDHRRSISAGQAGWSEGIWREFAGRLGILAILDDRERALRERYASLAAVMHRFGRALVVEPFLETVVLGGGIARRSKTGLIASLPERISAGDCRLVLADIDPLAERPGETTAATAQRAAGGWVLRGRKAAVAWGPAATHLIVSAVSDEGPSLFLVPAEHPQLGRHDFETVDARWASDVVLSDLTLPHDALIGSAGGAAALAGPAVQDAIFAICAEAAGVLEVMTETTIHHLRHRRQFGSALADFQVLRHRVAEMHMHLESLWSMIWFMVQHMDGEGDARSAAMSAGKVVAGKACRFIGQNAIQLHGAIGLTEDYSLGAYFKRSTVIERQFGTTGQHLRHFRDHSMSQSV